MPEILSIFPQKIFFTYLIEIILKVKIYIQNKEKKLKKCLTAMQLSGILRRSS
jgi:tellurite resistance protein TehA-like permease